jgi:hypothetical protein
METQLAVPNRPEAVVVATIPTSRVQPGGPKQDWLDVHKLQVSMRSNTRHAIAVVPAPSGQVTATPAWDCQLRVRSELQASQPISTAPQPTMQGASCR